MNTVREMGILAKEASRKLASASPRAKYVFLQNMARLLNDRKKDILAANKKDIEEAASIGMDKPRLDRLTLTPAIIQDMHKACLHVADMPDPIGAMERQWQQPNGILVGKMRIPLGVICMIYEARPNVTVDAAILCLKAGNAVILRGGSEALNSNRALAALLREALASANLPENAMPLWTSLQTSIWPWTLSTTARCSVLAYAMPWNACLSTKRWPRTSFPWWPKNSAAPVWNFGQTKQVCPFLASTHAHFIATISAWSSTTLFWQCV